MRIKAIWPVRGRKHKVTTDSRHELGIEANWVGGNFSSKESNRKWAGDITCIWTHESWLYLAIIPDLHSRRVVGWLVSDRMTRWAA
jgi:transposase InsO family protein